MAGRKRRSAATHNPVAVGARAWIGWAAAPHMLLLLLQHSGGPCAYCAEARAVCARAAARACACARRIERGPWVGRRVRAHGSSGASMPIVVRSVPSAQSGRRIAATAK